MILSKYTRAYYLSSILKLKTTMFINGLILIMGKLITILDNQHLLWDLKHILMEYLIYLKKIHIYYNMII